MFGFINWVTIKGKLTFEWSFNMF